MPRIQFLELIPYERRRPPVLGYALAVLLSAAAVYLSNRFVDFLSPMRLFFFWVAILFSAMFGIGPALLALVLSGFAIAFFVFEPAGSFALRTTADVVRFAMFLTFAGGISVIGAMAKRAQERAKALRDWLATTLSSIGEGVIAVDGQNRVIFVNATAETLTGWEFAEAIGQPVDALLNLLDPLTHERLPGLRTSTNGDATIEARDGKETWVAHSASPIVYEDGAVLGTVFVLRDRTQERELEQAREKASAALETAATTYRTLAEASPTPQAILIATPEGRIEWSDRWQQITGQTREDVERDGWLRLVHPDDALSTIRRWQAALASGSAYSDEIRLRVPSGRYRWFAIRAVPVMENDHLARWVGAVTDVHERKRHESDTEIVNRASAILSSSLDFQVTLRSLAKLCVPELADWCAIDLTHDNEPYERVAVEHHDPSKVELAFELDRHYRTVPILDPVARTLKTGAAQLVEEISDDLLVQLTRDERHLEIARGLGLKSFLIVPMTARGKILGALSVISAESGRRYSEEDLPLFEEIGRRAGLAIDNARLYREAELANRAKDEFLATLSHELRTPLTAIAGWASMLQMGGLDEATTRVAIETIGRSARAQGELIDDLLDLSRVVAGKLDLTLENVDLWSIARDVVAAAKPAADARKIRLRIDAVAPVIVRADPRRLAQIVWNLVSNSVKFTEMGGSIVVSVVADGMRARLVVEDDGRGIAPEFLPHVWERFRQADGSSSRRHGGLGLGLSLVKHLTELHGGSVTVESEGLGRGARFTVDLPLPEPLVPHLAVSSVQPANDTLSGRRILVVEDDPDTQRVIAAMLRQSGAAVETATCVSEALEQLGRNDVDLMVTDIAMPGEDGYALLSHSRKQGVRIPVLALSALGGNENRTRAINAGFDDFLEKPIEPSLLIDSVARQLRQPC